MWHSVTVPHSFYNTLSDTQAGALVKSRHNCAFMVPNLRMGALRLGYSLPHAQGHKWTELGE